MPGCCCCPFCSDEDPDSDIMFPLNSWWECLQYCFCWPVCCFAICLFKYDQYQGRKRYLAMQRETREWVEAQRAERTAVMNFQTKGNESKGEPEQQPEEARSPELTQSSEPPKESQSKETPGEAS